MLPCCDRATALLYPQVLVDGKDFTGAIQDFDSALQCTSAGEHMVEIGEQLLPAELHQGGQVACQELCGASRTNFWHGGF